MGLVDGLLVSRELCQRLRSEENDAGLRSELIKEIGLLLCNIARRRAEVVLEAIGEC